MPRTTARFWFLTVAVLVAPWLGGCAYDGRWAAAGAEPAVGVGGRWEGTWRSAANGHGGGVRCIVSDVTPESFKADFQATYAGFLSFSYQATMRVTAADAGEPPAHVYFAGEQDLGWLAGGVYAYDGSVERTEFFCTYRSADDHGTFQMTRPGGEVLPRPRAGEGK